MQELKKLYAERQSEFALSLALVNKSLRSLSLARIIVALVFAFLVYLGFSNSIFFYMLPVVAAGFLYLVSLYNKAFQKGKLLENLVKLNELEQKAQDHEYSNFNSGERFLDPHHPYSYDLDLFGAGSLFQYLNRCGTVIGENKLADLLQTPRSDKQNIHDRQQSVKDVGDKIQFRQDFWAHANLEQRSTFDIEKILEWSRQENFIEGKLIYKILLLVGPLIPLSLLAVIMIAGTSWIPALLVAMTIQWSIAAFHSRQITRIHDVLSNHKHSVERYSVLLNLVSNQNFTSNYSPNHKKGSS